MSDVPLLAGHAARLLASCRRFAVGEDGAGTTLAYLMVLPLYLVIVYVIVEACLIHNARIGTTYAAYAAARAAIVRPGEATSAAVLDRAAVLAFVPFAHSLALASDGGARDDEAEILRLFNAAAKESGLGQAGGGRLQRQYRYASRAVHVTAAARRRGEPWEEDLEVTVTYDFPFSMPIVGRLLGTKTADGRYVWPVKAKATLPMENPANERRSMGILREGE
jgi:hypothetical protein